MVRAGGQIREITMKNVQFTTKLAGKAIGVTCLYPSTREFCVGYLTDSQPDFEVSVTRKDIDFEREKSDKIYEYEFRDAYLETLAVYRKIAEKMPCFDTFLFHGSAIAVDGEAYLFTAPSGTGKSTHASLWRKLYGDRAVMINDDKPLISISDTGAVIHGTPWNGKHRLGNNITAPLKAICLLTRAEENSIREISSAEAYPTLIQQSYRPADPMALAMTMTLIDRLAVSARLYRLGCNMEPEAAEVAYNGMKG